MRFYRIIFHYCESVSLTVVQFCKSDSVIKTIIMTSSSYLLTPMMVFFFLFVASASRNVENMKVVRYIDISTQLVTVNSNIKVRNNNTDPIDSYVYIVDPEWVDDVSFIDVLDSKKNRLEVQSIHKIEYSEKTVLQYKIWLLRPLSSGDITDFTVSLIITNYLKSFPKSVKQNEKHMVLFPFNVYYHSMYFSHIQTTYLFMGTTKAALIDGVMYTLDNESENGLQYGPFFEVEPFKTAQSVFHYENNSPFLVVEKIKRCIKLSHWGFISVWDEIQLLHSGPKFKGPFKRSFNIGKNNASKDTKIKEFYSILPISAFDIYLKDAIGLIWNVQVDYDDLRGVVVSVVPRSILYGGWKTAYEIGYSLPISDFVTSHGNDEYELNLPLMDKLFENMIIKEAEINIILPEGANFRTMDPYYIENKTEAKYCYYFDTTCREMITFRRYNLVERHINNLSVEYSFSQVSLLVKPLTIAMSLYFIFIILKMFSRTYFLTQSEEPVRPVQPKEFTMSSVTKKKNKRNSKQKQF